MKRTSLAVLFGFGLAILSACGGGSSAPPASSVSQPDTVTGVDTPKSVSVVTAN